MADPATGTHGEMTNAAGWVREGTHCGTLGYRRNLSGARRALRMSGSFRDLARRQADALGPQTNCACPSSHAAEMAVAYAR
jgi:hypothetical protein